jgi:hypothetical protein
MSSFWSSNYSEDAEIKDPKRKFRFMVTMTGFTETAGMTSSTVWYAKTVTKPSFQIATAEHKYLNHTFFYPGTVTWQDVTLTLVDPTSPDVASAFGAIMAAAGYGVPSTDAVHNTITKAKMASAIKTLTITQMDGEGAALEEWTLHNALITEFKFGDLEYGADDLTELTMTLKYDWATMESDGTGSPYFSTLAPAAAETTTS